MDMVIIGLVSLVSVVAGILGGGYLGYRYGKSTQEKLSGLGVVVKKVL